MGVKLDRKNPVLLATLTFAGIFLAVALAIAAADRVPLSFGRSGIYAIFLSNGQVYFGRIGTETSRDLVLTDIYYLNLSKPVLSQQDLQDGSAASLVKLGNELHGPEDRMEIKQSQVLFVEKLKTDSKVTQAIEAYDKSGGGQ